MNKLMTSLYFRTKLLDVCENEIVSWEAVARECIAQMSENDCEDVCRALDLTDDDDDDDNDEDDDDDDDY